MISRFWEKMHFGWFGRKMFSRFWRKNMFLWFWQKNVFYDFKFWLEICIFTAWWENEFYGLARKYVLQFRWKMRLPFFCRKMKFLENIFLRFWRKCVFVMRVKCVLRFWRKICFTVLAEKCVFVILAEKYGFAILARNAFLWFWWENAFCGFGKKMCFLFCFGRIHLKSHFW